jgi:hypothetical protein
MLRKYCRVVLGALAALAALVLTTSGTTLLAQDFSVSTRLSQRSGPSDPEPQATSGGWEPIGYSVTYFHAGKVYDRLEQVGEVVILEPADSRFVILSFNGNQMATTLEFSQLLQYLKVARTQTETHVARLTRNDTQSVQRRQALTFQLSPQFVQSFDPASDRLTMSSPLLRYEVETVATDRPGVVQQYLQYADWTARLNYVLHSKALYPDVRVAVNDALAAQDRLPCEIRLLLDGDVPVQLRSQHRFEWSLGSVGHAIIRECETARTNSATRWVEFSKYQEALAAETSR